MKLILAVMKKLSKAVTNKAQNISALYHIHIMQESILNSHLTCFRRGFIAQLVEHRTCIAEVMGSNPVGARITFTCILYRQCTHMLLIVATSPFSSYNGYKLNSHLTCSQRARIQSSVGRAQNVVNNYEKQIQSHHDIRAKMSRRAVT